MWKRTYNKVKLGNTGSVSNLNSYKLHIPKVLTL